MTSPESPEPASRRERLRQQTLAEMKERAFELVDQGGAAEVTIAAVGKAMGLTAPALYRYVPSREALLAALVEDAYADLGSSVAHVADEAARKEPRERVRRVLEAYRSWALAHPRRYTLLFSDRARDVPDSAEGVAALNVGMRPLLTALGELVGPPAPDGVSPVDAELLRWAQGLGAPLDLAPAALRLAVLGWSRVHGLVSLEISGALANMGLDAGRLLAAEVEDLLATATG